MECIKEQICKYGRQNNTRLSLHNLKRSWLKLGLEFSGLRSMWTIGILGIYSRLNVYCNTDAFFSFDLFMVYIPEYKQQLRTMK